MMRYPLTVLYRDGTTVDVVCDQYAVGMYARWEHKNGLRLDPSKNPTDGVVWLRVMAWAEVQRESKVKASYDVWDASVVEVVSEDKSEAVDPTLTVISGG